MQKCFTVLLALLLAGCQSDYIQRPTGYFRVALPEKKYQLFDQPGYPYTFEYPVYARVVKDSLFFESEAENPWWINVEFPGFTAKLHISYKSLTHNRFDSLVRDAFVMTNKHTIKAQEMTDSSMNNPAGLGGVYFRVAGDVATSRQFFLTDTSRHFLRGALYFEAAPNADSLKPVTDFISADMDRLINSFRFR